MTLGDQEVATPENGLSIPELRDKYINELMCYGGSVSSVCSKTVVSLAHLVKPGLVRPSAKLWCCKKMPIKA